jgi:hypothetical protein
MRVTEVMDGGEGYEGELVDGAIVALICSSGISFGRKLRSAVQRNPGHRSIISHSWILETPSGSSLIRVQALFPMKTIRIHSALAMVLSDFLHSICRYAENFQHLAPY